ncbi:GNAT family N-acetyltransferase [Mycolicibacterium porcinum]
MSNQVAALESLAAEIEVVWGPHSVGAEPMPPVVIARAGSQWSTHVAPTLPNDIRLAVCAVTAGLSDDFAESLFDTLDPVLAPVTGTLRREVTLSYDCSRPASVIPPVGVRLITRADADTRRLRIAPDWGTQSDWEQILDNEFPWAAATDGNQVLSICETARWSAQGAEAGVWTLPGARGRGLAGAVVGAWSSQCAGRVPRLYYSTSVDNLSSQRVAEHLGLSRIGELWFLTPDYH